MLQKVSHQGMLMIVSFLPSHAAKCVTHEDDSFLSFQPCCKMRVSHQDLQDLLVPNVSATSRHAAAE